MLFVVIIIRAKTAVISTKAEKEIHNIWVTLEYELLSFSNGLLSLGRGIGRVGMRGETERKLHLPCSVISYFLTLQDDLVS